MYQRVVKQLGWEGMMTGRTRSTGWWKKYYVYDGVGDPVCMPCTQHGTYGERLTDGTNLCKVCCADSTLMDPTSTGVRFESTEIGIWWSTHYALRET
jgi:hypothetical protein